MGLNKITAGKLDAESMSNTVPDKLFSYLILFLITLSIGACTADSNSRLVDQDYLQSDDYRDFEQKSRQETARKAKQERSLLAHLQELGNCKKVNSTKLPLTINRKKVAAFWKISGKLCEQLVTSEELGFEIQLLKEIQLKSYSLKWVLLQGESVYVDWQLLAVTFQNDEMVDFQRVGVFQKSPEKDIDTEIKIMDNGENLLIRSTINRKIIYPIEQENAINRLFIVNSNGIIENSS